ncbi:hypothetical protein GR198_07710 [Rhizobium leguminosarum]|uniref:hypothetical protein n=1 Tax=Rhizobium leguminosarum TaxID=384 RepID=UPI0004A27F08|nr:hypothetical protein [Rhizobium leguminosarum]NEH55622.1 hypothetical protein [Rhizobium leguminosarum]
MDYFWKAWAIFGRGEFGSFLALLGFVFAWWLGRNQHLFTHSTRRKYKRSVEKRLERISEIHWLKDRNLHTVWIVQDHARGLYFLVLGAIFLMLALWFFDHGETSATVVGTIALVVSAGSMFMWAQKSGRAFDDLISLHSPITTIEKLSKEIGETNKGLLLTDAERTKVMREIEQLKARL